MSHDPLHVWGSVGRQMVGTVTKAVRGLTGKFDLPRGSGQAFRMK